MVACIALGMIPGRTERHEATGSTKVIVSWVLLVPMALIYFL
jgi:hypothetical protein